MANPSLYPNKSFKEIRKVCDGINSIGDNQDNTDTEPADALNMIFRNGFPETRPGSNLKWAKPTSETNNLLNLFRTRDSSGNEYPIAVYAPNFYVRDEDNDQWIKINHTYTPSVTYISYRYSYVNWDAGRTNDIMYAGNGQEDAISWVIALQHLTVAATALSTTLTIDDGTYFPNSGTIVVKEVGGSEIWASYSSKSGNVLTLSSNLGTAVGSGAGVTFQIVDMSTTLPRGKVMCKSKGKLFIANGRGTETTVYFSVTGDAEDFSTTTGATGAGSEVITDGERDITSLVDFGEYVLIQKANSAVKLGFEVNQDLNSFITNVVPVFHDVSMGPINSWSIIKKNNILYFPTPTEGIYGMNPGITGQQTSVQTDLISLPIQDITTALDFSDSRVTSFNQYLLWTGASAVVSDTIIVYDIVRSKIQSKNVWTKFDNWSVKDWLVHYDDELLFGHITNGNIYKAFGSDFVDLESSSGQTPYVTSFLTKRYDDALSQNGFGRYPANFKRSDLLHVQGYMTGGTISVDIMYDENGRLKTITKSWSSTDELVYQGLTPAMAMIALGLPMLGGTSIADLDSIGIFNFFIPTPIKYGYTNIQFKFYSASEGIRWGLTGYGFNPVLQDGIPAAVVQQT